MTKSRKTLPKGTRAATVSDAIRKPVAPPGHPLTRASRRSANTAERKAKHKRSPDEPE